MKPTLHPAVADCIADLTAKLPAWHFEQYGASEMVACFPPRQESHTWETQHALKSAGYHVAGVCGPFIVTMPV